MMNDVTWKEYKQDKDYLTCQQTVDKAKFKLKLDFTNLEPGKWTNQMSKTINNNLRVQVWYFLLVDCNESKDSY